MRCRFQGGAMTRVKSNATRKLRPDGIFTRRGARNRGRRSLFSGPLSGSQAHARGAAPLRAQRRPGEAPPLERPRCLAFHFMWFCDGRNSKALAEPVEDVAELRCAAHPLTGLMGGFVRAARVLVLPGYGNFGAHGCTTSLHVPRLSKECAAPDEHDIKGLSADFRPTRGHRAGP